MKSKRITRKPFRRQKIIKNGIDSLVKGKNPTLLGVTRLMQEIESWTRISKIRTGKTIARKRFELLKRILAERTPEEYAQRRHIPVPNNPRDKKLIRFWGCHQQSQILLEALRKIGIPASLTVCNVELGAPHTRVYFEIGGNHFEADPMFMEIIKYPEQPKLEYIKNLRTNYDEFMEMVRTKKPSERFAISDKPYLDN